MLIQKNWIENIWNTFHQETKRLWHHSYDITSVVDGAGPIDPADETAESPTRWYFLNFIYILINCQIVKNKLLLVQNIVNVLGILFCRREERGGVSPCDHLPKWNKNEQTTNSTNINFKLNKYSDDIYSKNIKRSSSNIFTNHREIIQNLGEDQDQDQDLG